MIKTFISYAPQDIELKNELVKHLSIMRRQGLIDTVSADSTWNENAEFEAAQVVILLVTSNFLADDKCYDQQMTRAVAMHNAGQAKVLPVILADCDWANTPFAKLRALPTPNGMYPVDNAKWKSRDEAFVNVCNGLRALVEDMKVNPLKAKTGTPVQPIVKPADKPVADVASADKSPVVPTVQPVQQQSVRRILFLAANPSDTTRLRIDDECAAIEDGLVRSKYRDYFDFDSKWAVTPRRLYETLLNETPHFLHFSGHGEGKDGLVFQDEKSGNGILIEGVSLAALLKNFANTIQCVVLNACYAEEQANAIVQHIPYVVGMNSAMPDDAAKEFSVSFYGAIGAGKNIREAFELAKDFLLIVAPDAASIPVIKTSV